MKLMKRTLFFLTLWTIAQVEVLSQGTTELPTWQVAGEAAAASLCVRSNVAVQLRLQIAAQVLDERSLRGLAAALDKASNDLTQAQIEKRVAAAAEQLQALSAQAAAIIKHVGNEPLALRLAPEKWQRALSVESAEAKMLAASLAQLQGVVGELHAWAAVAQRIVPPSELTEALRARVGQLLSGWQKKGPTDGESPEVQNLPPFGTTRALQDVVKLFRARVDTKVMLTFISTENRPYDLAPDHLAYLQRTGMPLGVISAMERHDAVLRGNQRVSGREAN